MPNRFPTKAANADFLGEDPDVPQGQNEKPPKSIAPPQRKDDKSEGEAERGKDRDKA